MNIANGICTTREILSLACAEDGAGDVLKIRSDAQSYGSFIRVRRNSGASRRELSREVAESAGNRFSAGMAFPFENSEAESTIASTQIPML